MRAPQQNLAQPGNLGKVVRNSRPVTEPGAPFVLVARTHGANRAVTAQSCRPNPVEVGLAEEVTLVAELASDGGDSLLTHVLQLVRRKQAQHAFDPFPR